MTAPIDLAIPLVPVSYVARLAALLAPRGIAPEQLIAGTGLTSAQLDDPHARMSFQTASDLFVRVLALTGDPSIGLELGLGMKATSHGTLGVAMLTCHSLRDAIALGHYMDLRGSPWRVQLIVEGERAIMRFVEIVKLPMRDILLEVVLGAVIRLGEFLMGESFAQPAIEFWSDMPEPPHHARFCGQVPHVRYRCPAVQAMFPASWLDRTFALREPITHREAVTALEHERRLADPGDDVVERARAVLADPDHGFPGLEQVAARLSVSARTLRRHLRNRGVAFYTLRDEVRRAHAVRLLEQSKLTVLEVARELGFADAAGFVRAFQRWTGETPSQYRKRARA